MMIFEDDQQTFASLTAGRFFVFFFCRETGKTPGMSVYIHTESTNHKKKPHLQSELQTPLVCVVRGNHRVLPRRQGNSPKMAAHQRKRNRKEAM